PPPPTASVHLTCGSMIIGRSDRRDSGEQCLVWWARSGGAGAVEGDRGTGKEAGARGFTREYFAGHDGRKGKKSHPFVAVKCGAIAESLLEAELFGYEEGA
ncbi:sigma 54-interacting transcriptional regulator, partial [Escherichia coli]|uniref:sigma 54-interacting transcriptional regulator n=1 Tax=Escherichia coli TaxID=562 RepID=UPI0014858C7F